MLPPMPTGAQLKQGLVAAAPIFGSIASSLSSGRGPYAFLDQGIATLMAQQKERQDRMAEENRRAAAQRAMAALGGGGTGGGLAGMMGGGGMFTGSNAAPPRRTAEIGVPGAQGGSFGLPRADTGVASGGVAFPPQTGYDGFTAYEAKYNLPQGYLARTAQIESGGNPLARNPNSSAGGLFQFIDSTAKAYGVQDRFDPVQATDAAARLARDNAAQLRMALGRDPTAAELYLAHQQGGGGAARLLSNPNARAADIVGADAVRQNGGSLDMTAGEFASRWINKFGGGGQPEMVQQAQFDPFNDPYVQQLTQVLTMPGLTPEERSVVEMRLRSRVEAITPRQPPEAPADFRALDLRAQAAGLRPGSPEYQSFMMSGGSSEQPNATERDIALLGEVGVPRQEAIQVLMLNTVSRDPVTGEVLIIDKRTGTPVGGSAQPVAQPASVASVAPPASPEVMPTPEVDEFGQPYPNAPLSFGLGGAARNIANVAGDVTGLGTPFPEVQQSMADFAVLQEKLINDVASAYDRQPPSWLLQNIRALTPQAGSIFTGPDAAVSQLDALGRDLAAELRNTEMQLNERLSPADRELLRKRRVSLSAGLDRVRTARNAMLPQAQPVTIAPDIEERLRAYE